MTDVRQFGDRATRSSDCGCCEAMLADAVDGALSAEEQRFFDAHIGDCGPCAQLLAAARRGAAWLEMLRTPAPEPPPALLEKILAQTSGAVFPAPLAHPAPALASGYAGSAYGKVLPFPRRARASGFARIVFEPRLAMTAAMAFFSIALTLDLMGVNPLSLRAGDFTPSGMERAYADLHARAVQYYEGLRVVYELESRVHDFENVQENARDAAPAQNQQQPAGAEQAQPSGDDQSAPDQNDAAPQAAPAPQQQSQPGGKSSVEPSAPSNTLVSRRKEGHERVERRAA